MRIIVDANAIIKMIFYEDQHTRDIFTLQKHSKVSIISCSKIENDWLYGFTKVYSKILQKNPGADLRPLVQSLKQLISTCSHMKMVNIGVTAEYSIDPGDNKYIQCAIDGGAEYIITYDGDHLISLDRQILNCNNEYIRILSPYQFLNEYKIRGSGMKIGKLRSGT